ncbi:hypothetical protein FAZ15_09605 [Sphingobacterium olei]|uniref:T9SS C-terminal target domain-containing protein n=1 Tax=Sphingobacterium olei TaxID=2571155 RepID=A0A4U0P2J5_9SPHI|nr:hypothetical protein [Sphingobacterium olei]TJZ61439.1 hypothetical protein FAZ15_09605 [Sphingobacterium olei]
MKKSISTLLLLAAMSSSAVVFTTSCSDKDPITENPTGSFELKRDDFKGEIRSGEHVTLESGVYKLTGQLVVRDGGKLTIKPGVIVEATTFVAGQEIRYIAVAQGGQIFVEGTKDKPVVMTSTAKVPQSWGGLVLCGKAPTNRAAAGQTASSEVAELAYGGSVLNDNSGSVRYLQILYSGYSYNNEKEFNGLSMFGVGSGTTIEYVQVHEGSDDGFEWFGGTVNTKYLVSTSNEDDQFDWTEGWNGSNENWYGKEGLGRGNRGIEADNNGDNHTATPVSSPTIKNLTLIGLADSFNGTEQQGIKLRVGTAGILENVVLSNWKVGLDVQHDATLAHIGTDKLKVSKVKFDNVDQKVAGVSEANLSKFYSEDNTATGAGAGTATPEWAKGWTVGL